MDSNAIDAFIRQVSDPGTTPWRNGVRRGNLLLTLPSKPSFMSSVKFAADPPPQLLRSTAPQGTNLSRMRLTKITGDLPTPERLKQPYSPHQSACNLPHVTNKYPNKLTHGFSQALRLIVQQETTSFQASPRELPGDIINSIRGQNKGRECGLFMDSLNVFIRLVNKEDPHITKSIRILFR